MPDELKENDIRPADLMLEKAWAVEADKMFLQNRISEFVDVPCPACGSDDGKIWGQKDGFTYRICGVCATLFTCPRPTEALLADFYRQSKNYDLWNTLIFPATEAKRKERIFVPRARRTIDFCKQFGIAGGTLLEVGAAFGTYCDALRDELFFDRIVAVEPTPGLAQTCRQKGFETHENTLEELSFLSGTADVVAAFEVLEHLHSPLGFVSRCADFLRPGGLLICSCPSGEGLGTLVLREAARVVDHEHLNYINPNSAAILLDRCGMEALEITTPGELDVDMLFNQIAENPALHIHCPIVRHLSPNPSSSVREAFQTFVKQARMSSHLWFIARKVA